MVRCILVGLIAAVIAIGFATGASAKRVALVIGNDAYTEVERLQKAVNDARAMAETLGDVGFEVTQAENLSRREMNQQLQSFASRLEVGDEALFFYAGHGVEIEGRNYLLPTDIPNASLGQDDFVKSEAVAVDEVLDRIRSRGTRISILVLDACRDNPFPKSGTRSLGGTRGLARLQAPEGAFVMYSAGVGQRALDVMSDDDIHPNSVFTRSLIPLLKRSDLSLVDTARQVRRDVQKLASSISHEQRPAYYDEVTGDFFFSKGGAAAAGEAAPKPTIPTSAAALAWVAVQASTSPAVLQAFIDAFPDSVYANFARARLAELTELEVAVGIFPQQPEPTLSRGYTPGDQFKDCEECPEMVVVPAGTFTMGSPTSEEGRRDDEGPQHKVTISKPFAVGKFEVTLGQFAAFTETTGYSSGNSCWTWNGTKWKEMSGKSWRDPGYVSHPGR